jgi:hypothetical protein
VKRTQTVVSFNPVRERGRELDPYQAGLPIGVSAVSTVELSLDVGEGSFYWDSDDEGTGKRQDGQELSCTHSVDRRDC